MLNLKSGFQKPQNGRIIKLMRMILVLSLTLLFSSLLTACKEDDYNGDQFPENSLISDYIPPGGNPGTGPTLTSG